MAARLSCSTKRTTTTPSPPNLTTPTWFVPTYGWGPGFGTPVVQPPLWPTYALAARLTYVGVAQQYRFKARRCGLRLMSADGFHDGKR